MVMTQMKGITCCGDCGYYNWKKHKCTRATDEGDAKDKFYADCPLPDVVPAQEPVEPVFTAMIETDMSYWGCGACGAFIFGNAYPHMLKENRPKYCGYCGRAVKWE